MLFKRTSNERYKLLRSVSRTFALSIEQLPPILREATGVAYLLFRVSDCLEDSQAMSAERKALHLQTWAKVLEGTSPVRKLTNEISDLDNSDPEVNVAQNAGLVLDELRLLPPEAQEFIIRRVRKSTLGMARWQEHGPFVEDEAALDDYMHEVAGRVGYLVTDLFAWHSPRIRERKEQLIPLSRECGLALQTVNVIRGMRKDYDRGWVFVPQSFYEPLGLTRETLFDPMQLDKAMQVVSMLVDKADRHLNHGLAYVTTFPRRHHRIRLALMWPFLFAVRTLAISRHNAYVLLSEAKIGRSTVKRIVALTKLLGWSNHWLIFYWNNLAQSPHVLPSSQLAPIPLR